VTWRQMAIFAAWVGAALPTEAQWEYAATSGGSSHRYPWGDEVPDCSLTDAGLTDAGGWNSCPQSSEPVSAPEVANPFRTITPDTSQVCSFAKGNTSNGLCDMAGNVGEFVQDQFHNGYFAAHSLAPAAFGDSSPNTAPTDGSGWCLYPGCPLTLQHDEYFSVRGIRGGSFRSPALALRTTWRGVSAASTGNSGIDADHGARLVRSLKPCDAVTCADAQVCNNGQCVAADACAGVNACELGSRRCASSQQVAEWCTEAANGCTHWVAVEACAPDYTCQSFDPEGNALEEPQCIADIYIRSQQCDILCNNLASCIDTGESDQVPTCDFTLVGDDFLNECVFQCTYERPDYDASLRLEASCDSMLSDLCDIGAPFKEGACTCERCVDALECDILCDGGPYCPAKCENVTRDPSPNVIFESISSCSICDTWDFECLTTYCELPLCFESSSSGPSCGLNYACRRKCYDERWGATINECLEACSAGQVEGLINDKAIDLEICVTTENLNGSAVVPICSNFETDGPCLESRCYSQALACIGTPTCSALIWCQNYCNGDEACSALCSESSDPTALSQFNALAQCTSAIGCAWWDESCFAGTCDAQWSKCNAPIPQYHATCGELLACQQQCDTIANSADVTCAARCYFQSDLEAQNYYQAFTTCYYTNGCVDTACVQQFCQDELNTCIQDQ
jgi:hypothetical protein